MKLIWSRIKSLFTEKSAAQNIALLIISIIITVSMSTLINDQVDKINKNKTKTISITFLEERDPADSDNIIVIIDNSANTPKSAYRYIAPALLDTDIEYEQATDADGITMIFINASANVNKTLTFDCPYYANTSIDFLTYSKGGKVRVDCESFSREYDLYSSEGAYLTRCLPISESYGHLIPYFAIYIAAFILITLLIYISEKYIIGRFAAYTAKNKDNKWIKYNIKIDVVVLFIGLSAFSLISYHLGAFPRFLQGGDQNHYWYMISDIGNFEEFKNIYDFRGYLCYVGPALCKFAGEFLGVDPAAIWIVFLNFLAAGLFGITFPLLAKKLYGYSITRPQVYFSAVVMCVLWRGLLAYVLMDFIAAVFFISGFTLYIYFLEKPTFVKGIFCGLFIAIAPNLKLNYQYVSAILIVIWTVYIFIKKSKIIKRSPNPKEAKKEILKKVFNVKVISSVISIALIFVVVCIPQLLINLSKGVASLTPFETDTSFTELAAGDEYYLSSELAASRAFNYMRLYPSGSPTDSQVQRIVTEYIGDTNTLFTLPQLFEMFLRRPIDTLIMMAKRIIIGMNVLDSSPYNNDYVGYADSLIWLKCLFNYMVIFGGVWTAFRNRKNVKEKIIFFCMFVLGVLVYTMGHVEWRQLILGYLFTNFYFCYSLMPYCADKSTGDTKCLALNRFYRGLSVFLVVAVIICSTIT